MTIPELYEYLCSPQFQDEHSGNVFYNYYIYQYPASKEYEMRRQIQEFKENLNDQRISWMLSNLTCSRSFVSILETKSLVTTLSWMIRSKKIRCILIW